MEANVKFHADKNVGMDYSTIECHYCNITNDIVIYIRDKNESQFIPLSKGTAAAFVKRLKYEISKANN